MKETTRSVPPYSLGGTGSYKGATCAMRKRSRPMFRQLFLIDNFCLSMRLSRLRAVRIQLAVIPQCTNMRKWQSHYHATTNFRLKSDFSGPLKRQLKQIVFRGRLPATLSHSAAHSIRKDFLLLPNGASRSWASLAPCSPCVAARYLDHCQRSAYMRFALVRTIGDF